MLKQTYIDTVEDIYWLRTTHCPDLPANIRAAIIHGNEDAPAEVEAWCKKEPTIYDRPNYNRKFVA